MNVTKVLTAASESGGSDEDVAEAVDGPEGGVGESVPWEDARRLNIFGHLSRMDCDLREDFVDMVEETIVPCKAV